MTTVPLHRTFAGLDVFDGLTTSERRSATALFSIVSPRAGTVLGREGEICREFVVVVDGHVLVSIQGIPAAVLGPGDHFGGRPLLGDGPERERRAGFMLLNSGTIAVTNRAEFASLRLVAPLVFERVSELARERRRYFDQRRDHRGVAAQFPARAESARS